MSNTNFLELERKWSELQEDKDRLEALIHHLEGEGGKIYDLAPQRGLYIEKSPCAPELLKYQGKSSADFLQDYKTSLGKIEKELEAVDKELKALVQREGLG